jgi:hypothetical protein
MIANNYDNVGFTWPCDAEQMCKNILEMEANYQALLSHCEQFDALKSLSKEIEYCKQYFQKVTQFIAIKHQGE